MWARQSLYARRSSTVGGSYSRREKRRTGNTQGESDPASWDSSVSVLAETDLWFSSRVAYKKSSSEISQWDRHYHITINAQLSRINYCRPIRILYKIKRKKRFESVKELTSSTDWYKWTDIKSSETDTTSSVSMFDEYNVLNKSLWLYFSAVCGCCETMPSALGNVLGYGTHGSAAGNIGAIRCRLRSQRCFGWEAVETPSVFTQVSWLKYIYPPAFSPAVSYPPSDSPVSPFKPLWEMWAQLSGVQLKH